MTKNRIKKITFEIPPLYVLQPDKQSKKVLDMFKVKTNKPKKWNK